MDKTDIKPIRKNSSCNHEIEYAKSKVLSRYLRGPTGSCHDNCKSGIKHTTETKSINHFPKRFSIAPINKTRVDVINSAQEIKKVSSTIPKPIKNEILTFSTKKDVIDPKSQDLMQKSTPLLKKTCSLPSLKIPTRRLSEIIGSNRDFEEILDVSPVEGLKKSKMHKSKSESRLKISSMTKKSSSVKSNVSSLKSPFKKVPTLITYNSFPKSKLRGSRKSKAEKQINEIVKEKTLYVIDLNNGDETTFHATSSSEEKISSPLVEDENTMSESQTNDVADLKVKNTKRAIHVGKLNKDSSHGKLKFNRGNVITALSESNSSIKLQFRQGKVLGVDQNVKANNKRSLRRLASDKSLQHSKNHSVKVVLKHQDMKEKKDQTRLINKVIKETASKLIRTKKSKVKALVGAFENLISKKDTETVE